MRRLGLMVLAAACGDGGGQPPPIDAAIDSPPGCTAPLGAGTTHPSTISADETWTAAQNPHVIPFDLNIAAKVTLEPCAVVRIAPLKTVTLGPGGRLVAEGTAAQPIVIEPRDAGTHWAEIRAIGGTLRLVHTTVDGGGDPLNSVPAFAGALDVRGDQVPPTQEILHAELLTVSGSASQGLYMHEGGGFSAASHDVTVTGSAGYPVHMWARHLGTLPTGNYRGNATDEILVTGSGAYATVQEDMTIHDRGVPYHVGTATTEGRLDIGAATGVATLTIEAGVTMKFKAGGSMRVEFFQGTNPASGALIAVGTAQKPIVFTSAAATPAAGDWLGIWFGETPDARDRVEFVEVRYAGGTSVSGSNSCPYPSTGPPPNNDAAIRVLGVPASAFVTNTLIADSGAHGIDRGFRSDTKTDFLPTNTFTNVARCKQTYPRDDNGACPADPPCP